jgi:hypothetical protein
MHLDLPNFAGLSTRLAADNAKVTRFIDRMAQRVDALLDALKQGDVNELRRLSENLAGASGEGGLGTLRYRAERVCEELLKPNNLRAIKRSVVHLIGACTGSQDSQPGQQDDWQI